jgi:hypothetical protein
MLLFEDRRSEHSLRSSVNSWFYYSFISLSLISSPQKHPDRGPEIAVGKNRSLSRSFQLKKEVPLTCFSIEPMMRSSIISTPILGTSDTGAAIGSGFND